MKLLKVTAAMLAILFVFCFAGCKTKEKEEPAASGESSTVSELSKTFTISNTTVAEIANRIGKLPTIDMTLSVTRDNLTAERASMKYDIMKDGKAVATVSAGSDLENKASSFIVRWHYSEFDDETNEALLTFTKNMLSCAWVEYNEENLEVIQQDFKLTVEYLNKLSTYNIVKTADAENGGFISVGMNDGTVIITVSYPNIVE